MAVSSFINSFLCQIAKTLTTLLEKVDNNWLTGKQLCFSFKFDIELTRFPFKLENHHEETSSCYNTKMCLDGSLVLGCYFHSISESKWCKSDAFLQSNISLKLPMLKNSLILTTSAISFFFFFFEKRIWFIWRIEKWFLSRFWRFFWKFNSQVWDHLSLRFEGEICWKRA